MTRPQPIAERRAVMTLPLLPKSLPCFLFCQSTSTMATQRALIPLLDFMAARLKCMLKSLLIKLQDASDKHMAGAIKNYLFA